jgi:hypothetical protein
MSDSLSHLIGKLVLVDLGSYQISGMLLSYRNDELNMQTRSGSRISVNRYETKTIRQLVAGKRRH